MDTKHAEVGYAYNSEVAPVSPEYDEKDKSFAQDYVVSLEPADEHHPHHRGRRLSSHVQVHDDVWGDLDGDGPNYRGLSWVRTSVILIKIQFGLGVLVMPSILHTLGLIPGVLIIILIGILTTWTDYVVGMWKIAHPSTYTLADVGQMIFGPIGREVLFVGYWLYLIFIAAAGLLGASTALNALSDHATCTAVFVMVAAVVVGLIASIQTLDKISWITWVGVMGIFSSLIVLTIAVGVQDRPNAAPQAPLPWEKGVRLFANPSLLDAMGVISTIIFSYSGAPAFFSVVSEMRDPRQFTKSLIACQTVVIAGFTIIGAVVYHFCGEHVSSPALGSAGPLLKKICYGLALPGLLCGALLNTHIPAKLVFVRLLRNSKHLSHNTPTHYLVWFGCIFCNVSISFIIAESIPVFNNLLSFVGALLCTTLAISIECVMYLWEERRLERPNTPGRIALKVFNYLLILASIFATITGLWASIIAIKNGGSTPPFSCADNSVS